MRPIRPFEAELQKHLQDLRKLARRLALTADAAEDLLQDTLERALVHQEQYKLHTNMRAWLFKIMRRIFTDGMRSLARHPCDYLDDMTFVSTGTDAQFHAVELRQACEAISRLTPHEQRTLVGMTLGIESFAAFSLETGIPVGTLKAQVSRARKKLRTYRPAA